MAFQYQGVIVVLDVSDTRTIHWAKKNTIHQVTTMLAISKNVLFPRHNHLLTTGADDPSLASA